MNLKERFKKEVESGRLGRNKGTPTSLNLVNSTIGGIMKGTYYLIGALSNTGKTAFSRDIIYNIVKYSMENKIKVNILDFSLEMNTTDNLAAMVSKKIYEEQNAVLTRNQIFSRTSILKDSQNKIVTSNEVDHFLDTFESIVKIYEDDLTPSRFHRTVFEYAQDHGSFKNKQTTKIGEAGIYTPHDPSLLTILLIDTVNLVEPEMSQHIKQAIDSVSRHCVRFRKYCNFTPIVIQQFNSDIDSAERRKRVTAPTTKDWEDSRRPYRDCDIALGLYNPYHHDQETYLDYDIVTLKNWFRTIHVMKNRFGEVGEVIPTLFKGAIGRFEDMPPPEELAGFISYDSIMKY